jgi:hypothetical protein
MLKGSQKAKYNNCVIKFLVKLLIIITLAFMLAGCGRQKIKELRAENEALKSEVASLEQEITKIKETEEEVFFRLYDAMVDYAGAIYANIHLGQADERLVADYAKARMMEACKDYIESYGKEKLDKSMTVALYTKDSWLHDYMSSLCWQPAMCERIITDIRNILESVKKHAEEGRSSKERGGK